MTWRRRFALAGLIIGLTTGIVAILVWQRAAAFNEAVSTVDLFPPQLLGPLRGDEPVNILLIGYSNADRGGAFLSDSLTVLSINPLNKRTSAFSVPRDLWLEGVAAVPGNGKVNEAFARGYLEGGLGGGGANATDAVEAVTGLNIAGWLALDFDGFKAMVEAVGGVEVDNPRAFRYAKDDAEREGQESYTGTFPAGRIQLDPQAALEYVQARYTDVVEESSDFARNQRQQRVLGAVREKIGSGVGSVLPALTLSDALQDRLTTNLGAFDLLLLAEHLAPDHQIAVTDATILRATRNSIGQYVLVVDGTASPTDYQPLHAFIADQLAASQPSPPPEL